MRSIAAKFLSVLVVGGAIIGGSSAHAQSSFTTDWVRISQVTPSTEGFAWVHLKDGVTVTCGSAPGQTDVNPLLKNNDSSDPNIPNDEGLDRVFSTLLSALVADREIRLRVVPGSNGAWCYIERVYMR